MIFSENRYPPRIKCGAGFFGTMRQPVGDFSMFTTPRLVAIALCAALNFAIGNVVYLV